MTGPEYSNSLPENFLLARFLHVESFVDEDLIQTICDQLGDKFSALLEKGLLQQEPSSIWNHNNETTRYVTEKKRHSFRGIDVDIRLNWLFGPGNGLEKSVGITRERCTVEVSKLAPDNTLEEASAVWIPLAQVEGRGDLKIGKLANNSWGSVDHETVARTMADQIKPRFIIPGIMGGDRSGNIEELQAFLDLSQLCVGAIEI